MTTGSKSLNERIDWAAKVLSAFYPQTVRQVYYVAISEGWLPPDTKDTKRRSYKAIQTALEKGRRRDVIPWEWITDVGRIYQRNFTEKNLEDFAKNAHLYYTPMAEHGCLLWVEKDTIVPTVEDLARDFVCPLVSGRGFSGLSHIRKVALNLDTNVERVLFIGDHDPSGMVIDESLETNLINDFGVSWEVERIALTWEQAQGLPHLDLKPTDSRTPRYEARYGARAWEVEALPVERLREILRNRLLQAWPEEARVVYYEQLEQERLAISKAMELLKRE
jgi:hypothetical protein